MLLYELKIKITSLEKKKLIDTLKLNLARDYSSIDYFLLTKPDKPKEKIEEIDGRITYSVIKFNKTTGLFQIDSHDITYEPMKISDYKTQSGVTKIHRIKEVYNWPGINLSVAFDYIRDVSNVIFFRVYNNSEAKVFKAKGHLVELGYRKFVSQSYIDMFTVQKPLYKEPLAWIVLITVIALGVFLLWYL